MIQKYLSIFFALLFCGGALATELNGDQPAYAVANIPSLLLESANTVVRYDGLTFMANTEGSITTVKVVKTILNKQSKDKEVAIYYDAKSKIRKLKASLYDANGKLIRKIGKDEIRDNSAISSFSIYEDNRYKYIDFSYGEYPYTLTYEYERQESEVLFYPSWYFISSTNTAVEKSVFEIQVEEGIEIDYRVYNCGFQPAIKTSGAYKVYSWEAHRMPVIKTEKYSEKFAHQVPMIKIVPKNISIDGLKGDLSNWKSYGAFMYQLNANRDGLSPEMKTLIHELIKEAETDAEKIEILYRYMQDNMRYVSVQLGIGGWQTFDAQYVEKNKYGDCKALTNFMKSMLKEVNIKAYAALIKNDRSIPKFEDDFAGPDGFNHVVLNIPSEDCWLECTSKEYPVNYLGSSNSNRKALLLTPEGGKMVNTPAYTAKDNLKTSTATIQIDEQGAALIKNTIRAYGLVHEQYKIDQSEYREEDIHRYFVKTNEQLPTFEINDLQFNETEERPESKLTYDISVKNYGNKMGKRFFIPLNCLNPFDRVPKKVEERQLPIRIWNPFTHSDDYKIKFPEGFEIESIPEDHLELETEFGSYSLKVSKEDDRVRYQRKLQIYQVSLPAERYNDLREFYKKVSKLEKMKMVLVKKKT